MKTYSAEIQSCFKCKQEKGTYVMQDKKLTDGKWKTFCKSCYFAQFDSHGKRLGSGN